MVQIHTFKVNQGIISNNAVVQGIVSLGGRDVGAVYMMAHSDDVSSALGSTSSSAIPYVFGKIKEFDGTVIYWITVTNVSGKDVIWAIEGWYVSP